MQQRILKLVWISGLAIGLQACKPNIIGDAHRQTANTVQNNNQCPTAVKSILSLRPSGGPKVQLNLVGSQPAYSQLARVQSIDNLPAGRDLIVVIDNNCATNSAARSNNELRSAAMDGATNAELQVQNYPVTTTAAISLAELSSLADSDPCILRVSDNGKVHASGVPNDPGFVSQKYMTTINASQAFDFFFPDNAASPITQDVVVAVVDTGVDLTHPDLAANLWSDTDGKHGTNLVAMNDNPNDDNGHGSHVSGIIAAVRNNGVGVSGLMGTHAKIMAVKVLDDKGSGDLATVADGILWAVQKKAQVLNLSLEATVKVAAIHDALVAAVNAGIVVTVAAGNSNLQLSDTNVVEPAAEGKDIAGVITVGSIDSVTKARSSFSNFDPVFVEFSAPGSNGILSTYMNGQYTQLQGTSMAAPMVAGAAALAVGLLKSRGYAPNPALIEQILLQSGSQVAALNGQFKDGKTLDLAALALSLSTQYPVQSAAPPVSPTPPPISCP